MKKKPDVPVAPTPPPSRFYQLAEPLHWDGNVYEFAELTKRPRVRDRINATKYVTDNFGTNDDDAILCASLAQIARFSEQAETDESGAITGLIDSTKLPIDTLIDDLEYSDFTELVRRMSTKALFRSAKKSSGTSSTNSAAPDTAQEATS